MNERAYTVPTDTNAPFYTGGSGRTYRPTCVTSMPGGKFIITVTNTDVPEDPQSFNLFSETGGDDQREIMDWARMFVCAHHFDQPFDMVRSECTDSVSWVYLPSGKRPSSVGSILESQILTARNKNLAHIERFTDLASGIVNFSSDGDTELTGSFSAVASALTSGQSSVVASLIRNAWKRAQKPVITESVPDSGNVLIPVTLPAYVEARKGRDVPEELRPFVFDVLKAYDSWRVGLSGREEMFRSLHGKDVATMKAMADTAMIMASETFCC